MYRVYPHTCPRVPHTSAHLTWCQGKPFALYRYSTGNNSTSIFYYRIRNFFKKMIEYVLVCHHVLFLHFTFRAPSSSLAKYIYYIYKSCPSILPSFHLFSHSPTHLLSIFLFSNTKNIRTRKGSLIIS